MKASELIKKLQDLVDAHGDLPVEIFDIRMERCWSHINAFRLELMHDSETKKPSRLFVTLMQ